MSSILPAAGPRIRSGIPARIATVSGLDIDAWEPRTLADALGSRAGVSIYDDLGSPYKLNLSTRGFNVGPVVGLPPGVSVFLDGVRQNEPDAAGAAVIASGLTAHGAAWGSLTFRLRDIAVKGRLPKREMQRVQRRFAAADPGMARLLVLTTTCCAGTCRSGWRWHA